MDQKQKVKGIFNLKIGLLFSMMFFLSACHSLNTVKSANENQHDVTSESSLHRIPLHNANAEGAAATQKVDNFFVIVDSSSSVNDEYQKSKLFGLLAGNKFLIEKELLRRINYTIPASLNLLSGIRTFGYGSCVAWQDTILIQSLTGYKKTDFAEKIEDLHCASGGSPAASALHAAVMDLAPTRGNIAVIFISDGNFSADLPVASIKQLKSRYGDSLCLYPIWAGNAYEPDGKQVLEQIRLAAQCGFTVDAGSIMASETAMVNYVHEVFYDFGRKKTIDSDNDHVADNEDQCPNTPDGATVNNVGCWIIKGIKFDTDKSDIKPGYHYLLDNIVAVINRNSKLKIEIQGHTDSVASAEYNLKLSQRRASSVLSYLESHGVKKDVLTAKGYGLNQPVDTNTTESGRWNNRRVELKILN